MKKISSITALSSVANSNKPRASFPRFHGVLAFLTFCFLFLTHPLFGAVLGASSDGIWTYFEPADVPVSSARLDQLDLPGTHELYAYNSHVLSSRLRANRTVTLPLGDGFFTEFVFSSSRVLSPEVQAENPDIQTFSGRSEADPSIRASLTLSSGRLHAWVLGPGVSWSIDPHPDGVANLAIADSASEHGGGWDCLCADEEPLANQVARAARSAVPENCVGDTMREFELAVAVSEAATADIGGREEAFEFIVHLVNDLNLIFERDLAVRFVLVPENNNAVYDETNPEPNAYSHESEVDSGPLSTDLDISHENLVHTLGADAFDIGFSLTLFNRDGLGVAGSGRASRPSICSTSNRGRNVSSFSRYTATPSALQVRLIAHEIGHQFGATHTFTGMEGNCSVGNFSADSAVEIGAGTTIMSYGGSCGDDNIIRTRELYFHGISLAQMNETIAGQTCHEDIAIANDIPELDALDCAVPMMTPFELAPETAIDEEDLIFTWEQIDISPRGPLSAPDNGENSLYRSYFPSADSTRIFPSLPGVLSGTLVAGERWHTEPRTLNFRLTARDGEGGVCSHDVEVEVVRAGPIAFTEVVGNNGTISCSGEVTWDPRGTDIAVALGGARVNILITIDDGVNYTRLAENVPNDGARAIVLPPTMNSDNARIRIEPVGGCWFAISPPFTAIGHLSLPGLSGFCDDPERGRVGGLVWTDLNNDATTNEHPSFGEADVLVHLYDEDMTTILQCTKTDAMGHYSFILPRGEFRVMVGPEFIQKVETQPNADHPDYNCDDLSTPRLYPVTIDCEQAGPTSLNFGYVPCPTQILLAPEFSLNEEGVQFSWTDVAGILVYRIYEANSLGEEPVLAGTVLSDIGPLSFTDTSPSRYYWIETQSDNLDLTPPIGPIVLPERPVRDSISGAIATFQVGGADYCYGYEFTPLANGDVTALACHFGGEHLVRIHDKEGGFMVYQGLHRSSGEWKTQPLFPVVPLWEGRTYSVSVYLFEGDTASYSAQQPGLFPYDSEFLTVHGMVFSELPEGATLENLASSVRPRAPNPVDFFAGIVDLEFRPYVGSNHVAPFRDSRGSFHSNSSQSIHYGLRFTPNAPGFVVELGGKFSGPRDVRLFDGVTGTLLGYQNVDSQPDQAAYRAIPPVLLQAGRPYVVAVRNRGTFPVYLKQGHPAPDNPLIGPVRGVFNYENSMPTRPMDHLYCGIPDFTFTPITPPTVFPELYTVTEPGMDALGVRDGSGSNLFVYRDVDRVDPNEGIFNHVMTLGLGARPGDVFVGDWDGDGWATMGTRRGNIIYLDNDNVPGFESVFSRGLGDSEGGYFTSKWSAGSHDSVSVLRGDKLFLYDQSGFMGARTVNAAAQGKPLYIANWLHESNDSYAIRTSNFLSVFTLDGNRTWIPFGDSTMEQVVGGDWNGNGLESAAGLQNGRILIQSTP